MDLTKFHITGVNLYQAGPGFPTQRNRVPVRNKVARRYVCPSYGQIDGGIVLTTSKLEHATHYHAEDVAVILAYLGPEWEAANEHARDDESPGR